MAVNPQKIRLGAPDSQVLHFATDDVDIGATSGGAELTYNPTVLMIEIDQMIMPVNAYKTKEEITYTVGLMQFQMDIVSTAWAYAQSGIETSAGTPAQDTLYFGNSIWVPQASFDATVPKNDGTGYHLRLHLNKVVNAKSTKIGFYRDKATSLEQLNLDAIADVTQPVGQQAGFIIEEH